MARLLRYALPLLLIAGALTAVGSTSSSASLKTPKITELSAVSCPTKRTCWAAGTTTTGTVILTTTNAGVTWTAQDSPKDVSRVAAIACPTTTHCWAIGSTKSASVVLSTIDGGTAWTPKTLPSDITDLQALTCPSATNCWAVGEVVDTGADIVIATSNGGATWNQQATPKLTIPMDSEFGIECRTTKQCMIVGYGVLTTVTGGSSWKLVSSKTPPLLDSVACKSAKDCVALGNITSAVPENTSAYIEASTNGGATWSYRVKSAPSVIALDGLACPGSRHCLAVGIGYTVVSGKPPNAKYDFWAAVETTRNGGSSWTQVREHTAYFLDTVSCSPGSGHCIAVGQTTKGAGVILKTTNYGASWTTASLPTL